MGGKRRCSERRAVYLLSRGFVFFAAVREPTPMSLTERHRVFARVNDGKRRRAVRSSSLFPPLSVHPSIVTRVFKNRVRVDAALVASRVHAPIIIHGVRVAPRVRVDARDRDRDVQHRGLRRLHHPGVHRSTTRRERRDERRDELDLGDDDDDAYVLSELWDAFAEPSAFGAEVPLRLQEGQDVSQYYVPFLSGVQLFVRGERTPPQGEGRRSDDGKGGVDF